MKKMFLLCSIMLIAGSIGASENGNIQRDSEELCQHYTELLETYGYPSAHSVSNPYQQLQDEADRQNPNRGQFSYPDQRTLIQIEAYKGAQKFCK